MASLNFEDRGKGSGNKGQGGVSTNTGVNSAGITGWNNDYQVNVTPALATTLKVKPGWYERVGFDSAGNITYAPAERGGH